eukprot:6477487-Alexandrium_andersonii.AAC.1
MHFLRFYVAPEELGKEQEEEAVDLARALFAAGASLGEARATLAEVFSSPRVAAQAERRPGLG